MLNWGQKSKHFPLVSFDQESSDFSSSLGSPCGCLLCLFCCVSPNLCLPNGGLVNLCPCLCVYACLSLCFSNKGLCLLNSIEKIPHGQEKRDTLLKSLMMFSEGLSHWLQLTLTDPDNKQTSTIKQHPNTISSVYRGHVFYKAACGLFSAFSKWLS